MKPFEGCSVHAAAGATSFAMTPALPDTTLQIKTTSKALNIKNPRKQVTGGKPGKYTPTANLGWIPLATVTACDTLGIVNLENKRARWFQFCFLATTKE